MPLLHLQAGLQEEVERRLASAGAHRHLWPAAAQAEAARLESQLEALQRGLVAVRGELEAEGKLRAESQRRAEVRGVAWQRRMCA